MLLVMDIGNTTTALAVFDEEDLRGHWRISTDPRRTADEYAATIYALFADSRLSLQLIDAVAISSVVPATVNALVRLARTRLNVDPLVLSPSMDFGLRVNYYPVTDVGADRIANAVAAHAKYEGRVIVVDFGTATTLDAVSETGDYLGGAILPGVQTSLDALVARAARLTGVQLVAPEKAIGTSTVASVQSGIIFGTAGQVDALVDRFQWEMGGGARVIATGGLAELIAPHSRTIECCDELLTLEGIKLIYHRARQ
ncbi:MAG: type III pantothenate kinase [Armatimonadota bacterium]